MHHADPNPLVQHLETEAHAVGTTDRSHAHLRKTNPLGALAVEALHNACARQDRTLAIWGTETDIYATHLRLMDSQRQA